MSLRLPRITASQIIALLEECEFFFVRQSGSHKIYKNIAGKRTTVPFHSGKILHPKLLKAILKDADISIEKLIMLLK